MKKLFILLLIAAASCSENKPIYAEDYKNGDTIYPDRVCSDTLIVFDAAKLNRDMTLIFRGLINPTDQEIDSVIHLSCIIKQ